jgi:hypothetical protein
MRILLPLLLIAVFFSCESIPSSNRLNNSKLVGSWYTCGDDGTYCEWYVKEGTYKFCAFGKLEAQNTSYSVREDTIFYNSPYLSQSEKAVFSFRENGDLSIKYLNDGKSWLFHPLTDKIKPFAAELKWNKKIAEQYEAVGKDCEKRKELINCSDNRTKEEIEKDSLDSVIDFKF